MIELPQDFDVDTIPATVAYSRDGRRAMVWHMAGLMHENACYARFRLRKRGVRVLNDPESSDSPAEPAVA